MRRSLVKSPSNRIINFYLKKFLGISNKNFFYFVYL